MTERAIDKMVKELEKRTEGHCEAWGAVLSLARRLALEEAKEICCKDCQRTRPCGMKCWEEAKEKPTQRQDSTRDQLRDVAAMADKMGCYDAADVIRNGWPKEKPTAPASLVEELEVIVSNGKELKVNDWQQWVYEINKALSRYRPSTQADIVGELKAFAKHKVCQQFPYEKGFYAAQVKVEEIIRKHEGATK